MSTSHLLKPHTLASCTLAALIATLTLSSAEARSTQNTNDAHIKALQQKNAQQNALKLRKIKIEANEADLQAQREHIAQLKEKLIHARTEKEKLQNLIAYARPGAALQAQINKEKQNPRSSRNQQRTSRCPT